MKSVKKNEDGSWLSREFPLFSGTAGHLIIVKQRVETRQRGA